MKLEETNYKVDSTWREVKEFTWYVRWEKTKIKCKVNKEWDIREYISWVPEELIGEQLFTYYALCRLWVEKRLPTFEQIEKLDKSSLAGYWNPNYKKFTNIGERSSVWLAGGDNATFHQNTWGRDHSNRHYGFSGRLLKELDQSDTSSIWLFEKLVERAEKYWAKLWASAWYELGNLLDTK